ncbi:hypothetical protein Mapa_015490 [Marchantia paleacea]|nr:hypothetical protein Mapa_015490 [Marchantia paleacea]
MLLPVAKKSAYLVGEICCSGFRSIAALDEVLEGGFQGHGLVDPKAVGEGQQRAALVAPVLENGALELGGELMHRLALREFQARLDLLERRPIRSGASHGQRRGDADRRHQRIPTILCILPHHLLEQV